ncbi:MAG: hypothetical protein AABW73_01860 [Nanoarchaeota archaeon]
MNKRFFDFNKEIITAEIGAIIGAPIASTIAARVSSNPSIISGWAVVGGMIGGGLFWLITRLRDHIKEKQYAKKKLLKDILYIVPMNAAASWTVYQPTLFFLSRYLLTLKVAVVPAVLTSQIIGFSLYLWVLDTYRTWVDKKFKKNL